MLNLLLLVSMEYSVTEYLHGMSRVTLVGKPPVYGTGVDSTLRGHGIEVLRFTIFQPEHSVLAPTPTWLTHVRIEARSDGSEFIEIKGWGTIELWPSEPDVRRLYRANAADQTPRLAWCWIADAPEGGFDVFVTDY